MGIIGDIMKVIMNILNIIKYRAQDTWEHYKDEAIRSLNYLDSPRYVPKQQDEPSPEVYNDYVELVERYDKEEHVTRNRYGFPKEVKNVES